MSERRPTTLFDWQQKREDQRRRLCVIGAPSDRGNSIARGTADAPAAIRRASLSLRAPAVTGLDWGDLDSPTSSDLATFLDRLADTALRAYTEDLCPLILGGDHSLTFAPVSALQRAQSMGLVWFDAHTDFSPWLGQAAHDHKQVLRRISHLTGVERIVLIGHRGITTGDERQLGPKAVVLTPTQTRMLNAPSLLQLMPEQLPWYISIDIDAVDPLWAPGTSAPVPDGLLPDEISDVLQSVVRTRRVVGIDVVEVNPRLDVRDMTSRVAAGLIQEMADAWAHQLSLHSVERKTAGSSETHDAHRTPRMLHSGPSAAPHHRA